MTHEFNICSGTCKYKDINFTFIFNGEELQLVPPSDKRETILTEWLLTAIAPGAYTVRTSLTMDEPYLIGTCNETNSTFIFIARQGGHIGSQNYVLLVPIIAYIECRYNSVSIARMSFTSPVINCIHPVTKGFGCTLDRKDFTERGIFTVTTQSFNETTTVPQSFMVDDRPVSVNFSISSRLNIKLDEPPLILESAMNFEFDPTNDYYFIFRLWSVESEIVHIGKVINDIIGVFGKNLYRLNEEELSYSEMGKRLSSQRNHYAHGDLDQGFIGLSLLDLMYMEYIIYAIQLNHYGIDAKHIRCAINDLFHLNYDLPS